MASSLNDVRVVAILNQKGGVGKTTTAVNLGAALALAGHRVLLVDADPQGNLTDHLGVDMGTLASSVYDVLMEGTPIGAAVVATATPGLSVLPAHADLAAAEQELAGEMAREFRLRRALAALPEDAYDWVLIDCPPSLGLLSLNAMAAARDLIITVQTEYFAMRGLGQLDEVVAMVRQHVNPDLRILGILPTLVNPVTRLAREVVDEIRAHYGALLFDVRIRQNVRLAEAPGHQVHIFAYDEHSAGAADYRALAAEVEARVRGGTAARREETAPGEDEDGPPEEPPAATNGAPATDEATSSGAPRGRGAPGEA
jgi:chromosome partitioning protein